MAIFKKKEKKLNKKEVQLTEEEQLKSNRQKTAQQWMPIADIDGKYIYRKDNTLVGMLRIQPENLELLSNNEKRRKVDALSEGFNGEIEGFQIFCIGRPVDLNNYLEWLQEKARMEQNYTRKKVLKGYINQASNMASSGETIERRFYLILNKQVGEKAEEELLQRLNEFQGKLSQAELSAHICENDELMDVLSLFVNPIQASFEINEIESNISTLLDDYN